MSQDQGLPLADLNDLVFTGWEIFTDDMYAGPLKAGVLDRERIDQSMKLKNTLRHVKGESSGVRVGAGDGPAAAAVAAPETYASPGASPQSILPQRMRKAPATWKSATP